MKPTVEIKDQKLILSLPSLRRQVGFSLLILGLLLNLKSSDLLNLPIFTGFWLLALHLSLYWETQTSENQSISPKPSSWLDRELPSLGQIGILLILCASTFVLTYLSESTFLWIETHLRVFTLGDSLSNWILLSIILVLSHFLGAFISKTKASTLPYPRFFPVLILLLIYLKGWI